MITVGIDPGLTGAVAFVDTRGTCSVEDLPTVAVPGGGLVKRRIDSLALAQQLRRFVPAGHACLVVLEDVHAMGGSAVQTMGSMMRTLGAIEGVLEVLRMPPTMVKPRAWKKHFGLGSDKRRSLEAARALYPGATLALKRQKDHNRAEALLLAHYGREVMA